MLNPMMSNLNQSRLSQILTQIKSMGNPQMMMQQMPQYKQVMDYVNQNGGDAKSAFYNKAKEMGVNPDEILKALRGA